MKNLNKRILISTGMGFVFGLICFTGYIFSPNTQLEFASLSLSNPMFWIIVLNRTILGLFVGFAGFITFHPFLKFKIPPILRGIKVGLIVSLLMAMGVFLAPNSEDSWNTFWLILGAGAFIGAIIDFVATKYAGEGKDLNI